MKRLWPILLCCMTISCDRGNSSHLEEKAAAYKVFAQLQEDLGLYLIDHKLTHSPKLKKIAVNFYHYDEMNIREARLVVYNAVQTLLDHFPLTQDDLEISISFVDPTTHKRYTCGSICHASLIGGRIHYSTYLDNEQRHETVLQESFVSVLK